MGSVDQEVGLKQDQELDAAEEGDELTAMFIDLVKAARTDAEAACALKRTREYMKNVLSSAAGAALVLHPCLKHLCLIK